MSLGVRPRPGAFRTTVAVAATVVAVAAAVAVAVAEVYWCVGTGLGERLVVRRPPAAASALHPSRSSPLNPLPDSSPARIPPVHD